MTRPELHITLERRGFFDNSTLGFLVVHEAHKQTTFRSVEREWRANRAFISCIPAGRYMLLPTFSSRKGAEWEVTGVPGRSRILLHVANRGDELAGCIALGDCWVAFKERGLGVGNSTRSMRSFNKLLRTSYSEGQQPWLQVRNYQVPRFDPSL